MSSRPRVATRCARHLSHAASLLGATALTAVSFIGTPAIGQDLSETQTTILERITVIAQRGTKNVLEVPQNVTVIDGEVIEDHVVRDIQDLVRYEPGVSVNRQTSLTNPFGQLTGFSIRGVSGNRVQMLVDGARIQEGITDGSRDFVDPWNMKQVELIRGPNSVLWGADALGGTVAFETIDPSDLLDGSDKPWAVEIKTAWDSLDNSFRQQITGAYDFGDVQVLGSIGHLSAEEAELSNADPDGGIWGCSRPDYFGCDELFPAETDAVNGLAKLVWTPNAEHEVTVTGEFFSRQTEIDQVWDSQAENPLVASYPSYYYASESYIRNLDMSRTRLAVEHDWQVGTDWLDSIDWKLSWSPQTRDTTSVQLRNYLLYTPAQLRELTKIRNYGEDFLEADVQMVSSFGLGESFHTLTYGFDGDISWSDYDGTDITDNQTTGVVTTTEGNGFNFPAVETVRADFYIQDEIKLLDDRLTLTPGVRLVNYSLDPTVD